MTRSQELTVTVPIVMEELVWRLVDVAGLAMWLNLAIEVTIIVEGMLYLAYAAIREAPDLDWIIEKGSDGLP